MKIGFGLPSGTYNLVLSKEDLVALLSTGCVSVHLNRVPCVTARAVYSGETETMELLDKKAVENDLRFHLAEPLADVVGGDHHVQFLNIHLDKEIMGRGQA
jgi:hypothetical protein